MKNIKQSVERALDNFRTSIIGTISSVIKKDKSVFIKVSDEEIRDIQIISPYGFFSLPLNGQMGQVIFNNTSKKASIIGVEHDKIPVEVNPGEAIIYCNGGAYILIKGDSIEVNGNLSVKGNITASGTVKGTNI